MLKVPVAGGSVVELAVDESVRRIALDATHVYWRHYQPVGDSSIRRVPKDGGAVIDIASGPFQPWDIAVDATSVYWTTDAGEIMKAPVGGGAPVTLASGQGDLVSIAVDATHVYWTDASSPFSVMKLPVGGGSPTELFSTMTDKPEGDMVLTETNVYWRTTVDRVFTVPKAGGDAINLTNGDGLIDFEDMEVDDANIYVAVYESGVVAKAPIGGGALVPISSEKPSPFSLAVDATTLYWGSVTVSGNVVGAVRKLAK